MPESAPELTAEEQAQRASDRLARMADRKAGRVPPVELQGTVPGAKVAWNSALRRAEPENAPILKHSATGNTVSRVAKTLDADKILRELKKRDFDLGKWCDAVLGLVRSEDEKAVSAGLGHLHRLVFGAAHVSGKVGRVAQSTTDEFGVTRTISTQTILTRLAGDGGGSGVDGVGEVDHGDPSLGDGYGNGHGDTTNGIHMLPERSAGAPSFGSPSARPQRDQPARAGFGGRIEEPVPCAVSEDDA